MVDANTEALVARVCARRNLSLRVFDFRRTDRFSRRPSRLRQRCFHRTHQVKIRSRTASPLEIFQHADAGVRASITVRSRQLLRK